MQIGADVKPVYFFIWGKKRGGGAFKIHRLGAVNKGRWEGGGNDKTGPLETVPGDWRPATAPPRRRKRRRSWRDDKEAWRERERERESNILNTSRRRSPKRTDRCCNSRQRVISNLIHCC
jgi:hypothetical protein